MKAKYPPCAYIPQGGGDAVTGHRCVGEMFSRNVAKLYLVRILTQYDWTLEKEQNVEIDFSKFSPLPFDGILIKMTKVEEPM